MAQVVAGAVISTVASALISRLISNAIDEPSRQRYAGLTPEQTLKAFLDTVSHAFLYKVEEVVRAAFSDQNFLLIKSHGSSAATSFRTYLLDKRDRHQLDLAGDEILRARSLLFQESEKVLAYSLAPLQIGQPATPMDVDTGEDAQAQEKANKVHAHLNQIEATVNVLQRIAALDLIILSSRVELFSGARAEVLTRVDEYVSLASKLIVKLDPALEGLAYIVPKAIAGVEHKAIQSSFTERHLHVMWLRYCDGKRVDTFKCHERVRHLPGWEEKWKAFNPATWSAEELRPSNLLGGYKQIVDQLNTSWVPAVYADRAALKEKIHLRLFDSRIEGTLGHAQQIWGQLRIQYLELAHQDRPQLPLAPSTAEWNFNDENIEVTLPKQVEPTTEEFDLNFLGKIPIMRWTIVDGDVTYQLSRFKVPAPERPGAPPIDDHAALAFFANQFYLREATPKKGALVGMFSLDPLHPINADADSRKLFPPTPEKIDGLFSVNIHIVDYEKRIRGRYVLGSRKNGEAIIYRYFLTYPEKYSSEQVSSLKFIDSFKKKS